ncbi:3404_t:CDS:2 [Cetraspora pellucida]|uniref:3404_t:CDS:1 n=1 Tax=Cetraspora pellucida TaxID=1433469 RepID=A0A9N8Z0K7_9GLOM|nr:3404_t:CDS:2 [Cetraspora pellucida]
MLYHKILQQDWTIQKKVWALLSEWTLFVTVLMLQKKTSTGLRTTKSVAASCLCKIVVYWIKYEYHMRSAHIKHNHSMDIIVISFDSKYCKLSHSKKNQMRILYDSGVLVLTIIKMLSEQYSRYIHNKDVYNSLNHYLYNYIKGLLQISELLTHLYNNSKSVITYLINNNRLHCLFFATQSALTTFKCYPEVMLIDTTYKTNHFGMPLLFISRVNAIGITFLIATVGNNVINKIQTILMNRDSAILPAIRTELLHVKHQICIWHIEQNIVKNLTSKLNNKFVVFTILYSIEEQDVSLFKVFIENYDYTVYHTNIELVYHYGYNIQFALLCHHIIAIHLTHKEPLEVNYIGTHWIILIIDTNNITQSEESYNVINNKNSSTIVLFSLNNNAYKILISKQSIFKSTVDLIKKIEVIANRVGHVEINNSLSLFINKLNNQYPLQQVNIGDSKNVKTKGRSIFVMAQDITPEVVLAR